MRDHLSREWISLWILPILMLAYSAHASRVCRNGDCPSNLPFAKSAASPQAALAVESVTGLTVIVDFPERRCSFTRQQLDDLLNKPDNHGIAPYYVKGSLRDYYLHVSSGSFDYSNIVLGIFTSKRSAAHYDSLATGVGEFEYGSELFDEVYAWLKTTNFDFSRLTPGIDSKYRAISIWYWAAIQGKSGFSTGKTVPGDGYMRYTLQPIYSNLPAYNIFAHESGHMLFNWPDLYDTDNSSSGIGVYGLMGNTHFSPQQPVPPDPYLRSLQGWTTLVDLSRSAVNTDFAAPASLDTAFAYPNPAKPGEMFIMENKFKAGWDSTFPQQGLMVWHVDSAKRSSGNREEDMTPDRHYMVSVVPSHGKHTLEKETGSFMPDSGLFSRETHDAFSERSLSTTDWWSGTPSCLAVTNIGPVGPVIHFTYNSSPHCKEFDLDRYNIVLGDVFENSQFKEPLVFTNLTSSTMTVTPLSLPAAWTLLDAAPISIAPQGKGSFSLQAKLTATDSGRFAGNFNFRIGYGTTQFEDHAAILGNWKSFKPVPDTIRLSRLYANLGREYLLPENGTASDSVFYLNDLEAGLLVGIETFAGHSGEFIGTHYVSELVDMAYDRTDCNSICSLDHALAKLDLGEVFKVALSIKAGNAAQLNYRSTLMIYSYTSKFEPIPIFLNIDRTGKVAVRNPPIRAHHELRYSRASEAFFADVARSGEYALTLYGISGDRVGRSAYLRLQAGENRIRFGMAGQPSGVYLARLNGQGVRIITRILVD